MIDIMDLPALDELERLASGRGTVEVRTEGWHEDGCDLGDYTIWDGDREICRSPTNFPPDTTEGAQAWADLYFLASSANAARTLVAEVRRCWGELYSHDFTVWDGGVGCAVVTNKCRYCGMPNSFSSPVPAKRYCAERHRKARKGK